jgi:diguanylate cyclase (GGDEF)-like protein
LQVSGSRSAPFVAAVVLVCALGYVDARTGYEISLGLFYVIPVALATWYTGFYAGLFLSVVSVIGMFVVDNFVTRHIPFPTHDLIPYWNTGIRLGYFIVIVTTLAALKRAHEREWRYAREDVLTGVANSQAFAEKARLEMERARRYNHATSIAYIDCDNFKQVNDSFGHSGGDEVLKIVATTLRQRLRRSDVVARLGGDEFSVLLPDTSAEAATEALEHVRAELLERMQKGGWPVTFSIGIVTFLTPPDTLERALKLSDDLMYAAKKDGKNTIRQQIFDGTDPRASAPPVVASAYDESLATARTGDAES